jgi:predicted ester cyclase
LFSADAVLDPQRTAADGRDGLQSAVPLIRGLNADDEVSVFTSKCGIASTRPLFQIFSPKTYSFGARSDNPRAGHAQFGEYIDFIQQAFPDFSNEIEEIISEGDNAFAKITYRGTHRGEVFGIAPTGRLIQYAGGAVFKFRGDRIADLWVLGDIYGLISQLESKMTHTRSSKKEMGAASLCRWLRTRRAELSELIP